jgi:hypothetical protein
MTTVILLVVVSGLIAAFSYYTNAGFGDRKPPEPKIDPKKKDQASAGADEPPPHK